MIKIKFLIIVFALMSFSIQAKAEDNILLLYKVNNEIITNVDVENEKKYLIALNSQLETLDEKQLITIAEDSIIREQIKRIELMKYYKLGQKNPSIDQVMKQFYQRIGLKSNEEFKNHLKKYNLNINDVRKKFEIESTWNQYIYTKFKNRIDIDEKKLKKKINDNKTDTKSYLLSEIVFKNESGDFQKNRIKNLNISIREIGFSNTANLYSIAESKKIAGNIGWVNEKFLSEIIISNLKILKIGEYTQPINVGANSLILKIEDLKIEKAEINQKKELEKLIYFETNKQLDKFSLIYFNRIKLDAIINEY
jgi:peptidyl-prolyl cis-trans isomerase SurA